MTVSQINQRSLNQVQLEFESLRARLEEAESTLDAIRSGEVDALVVYGEKGEQVFTLKGAEQPYRVFVEHMQEGAATLDKDGVILYCNQRLAEMLGTPLNRVIGATISSLLGPDEAEHLSSLMGQALESSVRGELSLVSGDKTVPALVSMTLLSSEHEAYLALTLTDLTEQKRNEEVHASERLARSILDNTTEAILVCDPAGRIIRANAEAKRLAGGDPMRQDFREAYGLRFVDESDPLATALNGERARNIEATLMTAEGQRDVLVSAGPLGPESGLDLGCVVTLTDITDRNQAFHQIKELNESLERKIEERTEQLVAANKELEGFCYSVSHDLRAPLRSMVASSMILREDFGEGLPPDATYELDRMGKNATKIATIVDDLLKFSRLGRQEMKCQPVNLSALAESVAKELKQGDAAHIDFKVQPDIKTDGDPLLLKMVLENLMGNSTKFTKEKPNATIEFGQETQEGKSVFFVRDNGVGFDMEYVDKIYRPFERLHAEAQYPGTGIGLANVQRIIARHDGRTWAQSALNEGTTIYFTTDLVCTEEE